MSVKVKKIERRNPQNPHNVKWYLVQESTGSVGLQEIAAEIEGRSALSLGDVQSVLSNLMEVMPIFLKLGQSIKLEGFGTFRVTVSSTGMESPEALTAHQVKGVKINFLPGVELKRQLSNVSFEIVP